MTAHCVWCNIALPQGTFEVTAPPPPFPLHVTAIHKACLSPHTPALGMHVSKHRTFKLAPFPADTYMYSHSQFSTPLLQCLHNQLISHIPCFLFDIQMAAFTGCPADNRKASLSDLCKRFSYKRLSYPALKTRRSL